MTLVGRVFPVESVPVQIDFLIVACGFESRASFASETLHGYAKHGYAICFEDRQELSFSKNLRKFKGWNFDAQTLSDSQISGSVKDKLIELSLTGRPVHVCIDVSSFSRSRSGVIFSTLIRTLFPGSVVQFAYSLAKYSRPSNEEVTLTDVAPLCDDFAGWSDEPDLPLVGVVGLGYEKEKALGVMEYLELAAKQSWLYVPVGPDSRFERDVVRANRSLSKAFHPSHISVYDVLNPVSTVNKLASLSQGLMRSHRVVFVPFGPKILTASAMVVSGQTNFEVPVWRASTGQAGTPHDVRPSGDLIRFACEVVEQ